MPNHVPASLRPETYLERAAATPPLLHAVAPRQACATGFLRLGQRRGYRGDTPACMRPEDAVGIWTPGELVMHTLWLRQSAALKGSHRCLILPCIYEEHDLRLCYSGFGLQFSHSLRCAITHSCWMADGAQLTDGQAAFVSGLLNNLNLFSLNLFAATVIAARQNLSSDTAALAARVTAPETARDAALGDTEAGVPPFAFLLVPILSDVPDAAASGL
jgi:hypothetical protein